MNLAHLTAFCARYRCDREQPGREAVLFAAFDSGNPGRRFVSAKPTIAISRGDMVHHILTDRGLGIVYEVREQEGDFHVAWISPTLAEKDKSHPGWAIAL